MALESRDLPFVVPRYSLTGDILSYQRCGLQYRYYNGSSLPPSRPVQLWTGEFIHGILEEVYRVWREQSPSFPWPCHPTKIPREPNPPKRLKHDIGEIGDKVEARLAAAGNRARSGKARTAAYDRVDAAVNLLGPHLFPLITSAEERLSGTRDMPKLASEGRPARGDKYELTGVVDVISSVQLKKHASNLFVKHIVEQIQRLPDECELIVDYKGSRRPTPTDRFWNHYLWQVRTYAWLRSRRPDSPVVGAAVLIYINELKPLKSDIEELIDEIREGTADVVPAKGSADYYALQSWDRRSKQPPMLSEDFRLRRALQIVPIQNTEVEQAVGKIDYAVRLIEESALKEFAAGDIPSHWETNGEARDCVACDFKHFCPSPADRRGAAGRAKPPKAPQAPG